MSKRSNQVEIEILNYSDEEVEVSRERSIRRKPSMGFKKFPAPREPREYQRAKIEDDNKFQTVEELASVEDPPVSFRPRQLSRNGGSENIKSVVLSENSSKSWLGKSSQEQCDKENSQNASKGPRIGWNEAKQPIIEYSVQIQTKGITRDSSPQHDILDDDEIDAESSEDIIEIDSQTRNVVESEPVVDILSTSRSQQNLFQKADSKHRMLAKTPSKALLSNLTSAPDPLSGIQRKSGRYDHEDESAKDNVVKDWEKLFSGEVVSQNLVKPIVPFVLRAHPRGQFSDLVQCNIVRDRSTPQSQLYPTYELYLQEPRKLLCIAMKMSMNRTSNYHLFDMTRGQLGTKFTKKSGNYLGKLRAHNSQRTTYSLVTNSSDKEEIAGIVFEKVSTINFLKDGSQPRRMYVAVPHVDFNKVPIPNKIKDFEENSLAHIIEKRVCTNRAMCFQNKDPVLENGNYRLNFRGRVTKPSVKNFQLVSPDTIDNIVCQFGKTGEDNFNLDFKSPLCALQAFSFALCQFNL